MKPRDIRSVKNALLRSVFCVTFAAYDWHAADKPAFK
jgi:hypothetical protein